MRALLESVPNFSEGRDPRVIRLLAGEDAIDVHADARHHRSVVTLVGADEASLNEALMRRVGIAVEAIDLRRHQGLHPRLGAVDVVPVVPLAGYSMDDATALAREVAETIWDRYRVPSWYYGLMAGDRRLADLRGAAVPPPLDVGDRPHPTAGVCCVGARAPLVAYNLVFDLPRAEVSRALPELRRLPGVRALSFPLPDGRVQLSVNLTQPWRCGVPRLQTAVSAWFGEKGTPELVGLCPAVAAGPGCEGGILEARLVASAARELGGVWSDDPLRERRRMGARLLARAEVIAASGPDEETLLRGAEEAVTFLRLGASLGGLSEAAAARLETGASGLRAALDAVDPSRQRRRDLLDAWLAVV